MELQECNENTNMKKKTIYKNLITKIGDGWITIYFNRPESRNALSSELVIELSSLLDEIAKDDKYRGITFRGKGGIFCAGGDLKGFKSIVESNDTDAETIKSSSRLAGKLFERINTMPQVVLMFVEPLPGYSLESVFCTGFDLILLALTGRIDIVGKLLSHDCQFVPRLLESDIRVTTQRQPLLFPVIAILEAPVFPAVRMYFYI